MARKEERMRAHTIRFFIDRTAGAVLAGIASLTLVGAAMAFDAVTLEDYSGEELYLRFCASCHGTEALGNGPVSRSLNVAVPDLTKIASRYGAFPAGVIRDIIDGRGIDSRAHGTREMPVWGYEFWIEEGADVNAHKAARDAINKLVEHLRSLQRGDDDVRAPGSVARQ
jgi:mono/diheme cytochrome c family protein